MFSLTITANLINSILFPCFDTVIKTRVEVLGEREIEVGLEIGWENSTSYFIKKILY